MRVLSWAKVNLHLQVVGRRPDGYHELRTLFHSVDLADELDVEADGRAGEVVLEVEGGAVGAGPDNLVTRAVRAHAERWPSGRGVRCRLRKRIPVGGGLGGGSSNAAAALRAMRRLTGRPGSLAELWPVARELGADVPYFLVGGTALGIGRGDEVLPLPELAPAELWLATPPEEVATAEIFAALEDLTARPLASSILSLARGLGTVSIDEIGGWNDLQDVVFQRVPAVREVYDELIGAGARTVRLSGSGATVFARFDEAAAAESARAALPAGSRLERVRTLTRRDLADELR